MLRHCATVISAFSALSAVTASTIVAQQTITDYTRSFEKREGYFPLYWDGAKGRLLLEIPAGRLGEDFLYLPSLATGVGALDLGLDRGTIGDETGGITPEEINWSNEAIGLRLQKMPPGR